MLDAKDGLPGAAGWFSLPPEAPRADCVEALHGLRGLPHPLNTFVWSVYDDAEMAALVVAAGGVPFVCLNVPEGSCVTPYGLMQLGRLHMVGLQLHLHGISFEPAAARMLLSCLDGQARVRLHPATLQQAQVFSDAMAWLDESNVFRPDIWVVYPNAYAA